MVGALAWGHSPLKDEVEPVSNYSHPDEPDAHCFIEVEPDGEEDKESIPEISSIRDEEEPVLGALEVLLQPVCGSDAGVMQEVHVGLHPPQRASGCPVLHRATGVLYSAGSCLQQAGHCPSTDLWTQNHSFQRYITRGL